MDIREYLQKEQKGFYKIITENLTTERRKQLYDAINDWHESELKLLGIGGVSTRYIVAKEKEDIFEQLTCCVYDNLNDAQNFADAMADSLDYWDKKIVILNVC